MAQLPDFITLDELGDLIEGQVHPVILSYENEHTATHHGVGTAFVLEHGGELFVISAQHVLVSQYAKAEDLRIRLRNAPISIVFDRKAVFVPDFDPDFDLLILRILESQHEALISAGLSWIRATDIIQTEHQPSADVFRVFGYPAVGRAYDYDKQLLSAVLYSVNGVLVESTLPGLTTLKVVGDRPAEFRGMSGSVVIAETNDQWQFAGMVTLASDVNGLLNFIPAEKILYYLDRILMLEMTGEFLKD